MWWLGLSAKRTTLSSMLGQYRGPVEAIWPEYIGARCRLARMISWIRSLLAPIQQWTWGRGGNHFGFWIVDFGLEDAGPQSMAAPSIRNPQSAIRNSSYSFKYENG